MKIALISLGCPKNQTDLEYLAGDLKNDGIEFTDNIGDADAVIVNTCGFIEPAVNEAIENILMVNKEKRADAKLIVTGCMVERYKNEFSNEFPEVDFFTGVGTLYKVREYLENKNTHKAKREFYGSNRMLLNTPYYAYLKISEGCNNNCSYCTIPSIRGRLVSRNTDEILREAENLVKNNAKELIIISQDTTKYGIDIYGKPKIKELLKSISKISGDFKIRLLYLNPDGINKDFIDFVFNNEKILNYFEVPVQHFSDKILKLMNRKSDSNKIKEVFEYIRSKNDFSIIRTTAIVGFPGETEEDFLKLLDFIEQYKPDFAGFFPYYKEEGTKAANMKDMPSKKAIRNRLSRLKKAQKKNTMQTLKNLKKGLIECYVEKSNDDFEFILEGRAAFQAPEIDGKAFFIDGHADKGAGPYKCKIKRIVYPDIYCQIVK
jgi:ribosomal protein S12 methylthiotransferase